MEKILYNNIELLKKIDAKLAYQLMMSDPSALDFCVSRSGQTNLKRIYQDDIFYYHSEIDPTEEANEWFLKLNIGDSTVLYVYGVGLGYYYDAARVWLRSNPKNKLIFLEEDLGVLHRLFETEKGTEILNHLQVKIVTFTDLMEDKEIFSELAWTYINAPFTVSALKLYEDVNSQGVSDLAHQVTHESVQKSALADEYQKYGVPFFRNFYPNLLELPKAIYGNGLFDLYKNVPAIICGAGPSLNKNIGLLKTLNEQALIFAGSSSLPALLSKGVIPHFGAAIDPNLAQVSRVQCSQGYLIPFFYRNRLYHEALKAISSSRLFLTGAGGYDIAEWFEQELGLESDILDEGHNIVNFCIEIANALGCNPIILVGVDLAYTNNRPYAEGVEETLNLPKEKLVENGDLDSIAVQRNDINGEPVYTLWKWITEAEWTAKFAEDHPDITIINATEGGLGFRRIPNESLANVAQEYLKNKEDFHKRIAIDMKNHSLSNIIRKQIEELMIKFQNSLKCCMRYLENLMDELDQIKINSNVTTSTADILETPKIALIESELEEEIGYRYLLETFNIIYMKCHQRQIEELQSVKNKMTKIECNKQKIVLQKERLSFLKDVSEANIELINMALHNKAKEDFRTPNATRSFGNL
ncbi:MAG: motility associated factor glycosyltransferase family protein [Parachlamydiaceae bacterium]|nr:motility associated factor glycosyltransferase family protein [Parachlamydiaceae bacterium]